MEAGRGKHPAGKGWASPHRRSHHSLPCPAIPRARETSAPRLQGPRRRGSLAARIVMHWASTSAQRSLSHRSGEPGGRTWGQTRRVYTRPSELGPQQAQMQRPRTAGKTPGTHLGLSEPWFSLPKHRENGHHVGRPACPQGSLAPLPDSSQQPALQAQPGVGGPALAAAVGTGD